jgi:hypothetical protein
MRIQLFLLGKGRRLGGVEKEAVENELRTKGLIGMMRSGKREKDRVTSAQVCRDERTGEVYIQRGGLGLCLIRHLESQGTGWWGAVSPLF